MAVSHDTAASPSRRSYSLFLAPSTSRQYCGMPRERLVHEWMNGRLVACQHQAPSRQETKGCPRESAGEFLRLGMLGGAEAAKLDDGTEAASSVVED